MVTEVRGLLLKELATRQKGVSATDAIRAALNNRYGSRVEEEPYAMYYAWEWDSELGHWVYVCSGGAEFEVKFGRFDAVIVETADTSLIK